MRMLASGNTHLQALRKQLPELRGDTKAFRTIDTEHINISVIPTHR